MQRFSLLLLLLSVPFLGCTTSQKEPTPRTSSSIFGAFHRPITTSDERAQAAFDDGLLLVFGFSHEEAMRRFSIAATEDPDCAMAFWGRALAAGPHINNPSMTDDAAKAAVIDVHRALARAGKATPVERDLIDALTKRYVHPLPKDRRSLDVAYADAMREVWRRHPGDADVGALFAEALMDLRPWDLWSVEQEMRPETPEVIATLDAVLAIDADHPGGLHYYIHALEPSPWPERAMGVADRLRDRAPGIGHLVHMPSHIDVLTGRWEEAVVANQKSIVADLAQVRRAGAGGFLDFYRLHNYDMLVYAAMFDGQSRLALETAREMVRQLPADTVVKLFDFVESFMSLPYHVMIRFGMWEQILAEPMPDPRWTSTTAYLHYARALAYAATNRVTEAEVERKLFGEILATVPPTARRGNNSVQTIGEIASRMVDGEIAYRKGEYEAAFGLLREAVERVDKLRYDEPWGWMQPVRHALGALLLEQGRIDEAASVYEADLERHPENLWALHGLAECRDRQGRMGEAHALSARFSVASRRADVSVGVSCFCRTGSVAVTSSGR